MMEKRELLQYLIDTSDITVEKKQEATEYLNNLWNVQLDEAALIQAAREVVRLSKIRTPKQKLRDAIRILSAALLPSEPTPDL